MGSEAARAHEVAPYEQPDLSSLAPSMLMFMRRIWTTAGVISEDPCPTTGDFSRPGCCFAAPSLPATAPGDAAVVLRNAADAMLRAIIFDGVRSEPNGQFDGTGRYEKSVYNPSWSYASFLSALRARAK
ncbi:hypothetical protein [uncultured Rhodoblastus sp.]|uniref:hypothetical protein n=1 Tax=uncultured Rhodoblastus sp. TaxID=543037 RepID=UPI0025FA02AC|nr:hypothetical protein [uncultured Rhodoblastus sp.]